MRHDATHAAWLNRKMKDRKPIKRVKSIDYRSGAQIDQPGREEDPPLSHGTIIDQPPMSINIGKDLPDNVAVLLVSSYAQPKLENSECSRSFRLQGWNSLVKVEKSKNGFEEVAEWNAIVSVAELMEEKDPPAEILGKNRLFSEGSLVQCKKWLKALRTRFGQDLCLVLYDMTKLEIPWELIELNRDSELDGKHHLYLGAEVRVVRWLQSEVQKLQIQDELCEGETVAFLDPTLDPKDVHKERASLHALTQLYPSLQSLEDRLYASLKQVGLVYVGCHGEVGSMLFTRNSVLSAARLALIDEHLQLERPLVFLNACESGRILNNKRGDSSFVKILLKRCARGFVGTLGKVGTPEASGVAQRMLKLAHTSDGVFVAEVLRMLRFEAILAWEEARREVSEKVDPNMSEEYKQAVIRREGYARKVLYTFMYVYYGNPLMRLRLYPVQNQQEEA